MEGNVVEIIKAILDIKVEKYGDYNGELIGGIPKYLKVGDTKLETMEDFKKSLVKYAKTGDASVFPKEAKMYVDQLNKDEVLNILVSQVIEDAINYNEVN